MMTLSQVLAGVRLRRELIPELDKITVAGLDYDSRRIERDFLFFAFPGSRADGRKFADDAVRRGACAIVSELSCPEGFGSATPWIESSTGAKLLPVRRATFTRSRMNA